MGYERLEKSLTDTIKEEQAKLGFRKEAIRLYYPLSSLNHFFDVQEREEQMLHRLQHLPETWQECLCLVKKQNQNTSIDSSLPLFRSLKELAKICYNFQNSRTFDVAKPLYIMKGGLERYGFGRTI